MDERRLLAILREEEADASTYYQSDLAQAQTEAMERYFGEPYGNEIEGHPAVVSQDVADTINWMMPALMRMFLADDLIAVESPNDAANDQEQEIETIFSTFSAATMMAIASFMIFFSTACLLALVLCMSATRNLMPKRLRSIKR